MKTVRIANGQAFWGDSASAPVNQVRGGQIDYLTLDYLAEITMSILRKQADRNPALGYATDFVELIDEILPEIVQKGVKVVANAGGVNPAGCRDAIAEVVRKQGFGGKVKVAIIEGDDILDRIGEIHATSSLDNMETGESFEEIAGEVVAANMYIGAAGVAEALDQGADIVVVGRCNDPALVLGPLIHEFGWSLDDYDKMAAGTLVGHMIECGAQATGGNFQGGWQQVPDLVHVGYPIAEVESSGEFVLTKHEGTGGMVTVSTATEQFLYEMGNPAEYLSPDVKADFSNITMEQVDTDRVLIRGARGSAPTGLLKASMAYNSGFRGEIMVTYAWPDALEKARFSDSMVRTKIEELGLEFEEINTSYIGYNSVHGPLTPSAPEPNELVLRIAVRGQNPQHIAAFGRELAPLISGPPGLTGLLGGGRTKPSRILAYWPALVPAELITVTVDTKEIS